MGRIAGMARKSKRRKERLAQKRAGQHTQQVTSDVSTRVSVSGRDESNTFDSKNGQGDGKIFVQEPPQAFNPDDWSGPHDKVGYFIENETAKVLDAYEADPRRLDEDAAGERFTSHGGYANRQLVELVQNSADALTGVGGHILIMLTEKYLYCADDGGAISVEGVDALMRSYLSPKSGTEVIGRFGLGFKAVLAVTDSPEFFSRSGSFVFDRARSEERIRERVPDAPRFPVLRLPEAIDAVEYSQNDSTLRELMGLATNIVRLPLKPGTDAFLSAQMGEFRPECLFFMQGVRRLTIADDVEGESQCFTLDQLDDEWRLNDGEKFSQWKLFTREHELSSNARADYQTELEQGARVKISWAVPLERLRDPGYFWAFFPTEASSLVSGILNTHWKTNEDRQNLLPSDYNDELILEAAKLLAESLSRLWDQEDPSRHLDVLPRLSEAGDARYAEMLRNEVFRLLYGEQIIPDQLGTLRGFDEIQYPPNEVTEDANRSKLELAVSRWQSYEKRPTEWVHHSTYTSRVRWATVDRLCDPEGRSRAREGGKGAPRSSFADWLESLIEGKIGTEAVEASKAAIQTAALIPSYIRERNPLGNIILTRDSRWRSPSDDNIFLPSKSMAVDGMTEVHPELASDSATRSALEILGIQEASPETRFNLYCKKFSIFSDRDGIPDTLWPTFWDVAAETGLEFVKSTITSQDNWHDFLRVRTISGSWKSIYCVLVPGKIVPADGSRDTDVALDIEYHSKHLTLLKSLGVTDLPRVRSGIDIEGERLYLEYLRLCRDLYRARDDLPRTPRKLALIFSDDSCAGPIEILPELSELGKVLYTDALLSFNALYDKWVMEHKTVVDHYPRVPFPSPAIWMLRRYGRIATSQGIVRLSDVLNAPEQNREALVWLLEHENGKLIREAFGLQDVSATVAVHDLVPYGESAPIALTEEWPALKQHLSSDQSGLMLIRCDEILTNGQFSDMSASYLKDGRVYLVDGGNGLEDISSVATTLGIDLHGDEINDILRASQAEDVARRIEIIRQRHSDAERLLAAVGEDALRDGLSDSVLSILEKDRKLSGVEIAEAAISTYHTAALWEYRHALNHLGPPKQWAGKPSAVSFVTSLGFSPEWAGERSVRRDPFIEVMGPYSLPDLHDYQQIIAARLRQMLRSGPLDREKRRGMISLPTGSGKTRVAVQGIVESMRDDDFAGGVLWVADRDELCEQAVESWQQVWASLGSEAQSLRISRMWAGQPAPVPTSDLHVVVASIQSLYSKLNSRSSEHDFLRDFKLVVFDEAHRSIAPTFTSAMEDIGFTRRQGAGEPFLLGLTATPYRGHNEDETRWLTNRYGRNRLDDGAFPSDDPNDVILELQRMQVLARAEHEEIEGGMFGLTKEEVQQAEATPWLPRSAEERLAQDPDRTERILDAYQEHVDGDWATLIFATSVEHAQTLSALLNSRGVKARAVSGSTDRTTRRRVVDEFRNGDIKVLVNYGVFREGFDAPKTRAIIVARPVYSPNLYFQMIGRGLRGIKNGGNARCLILNVQDNIENFERKLAFTELDWLWDGG